MGNASLSDLQAAVEQAGAESARHEKVRAPAKRAPGAGGSKKDCCAKNRIFSVMFSTCVELSGLRISEKLQRNGSIDAQILEMASRFLK